MSNNIIFLQHEGGFFSNFNKVISYLANNSEVSKITWDLKGQPYGAFAYSCDEVFSHLFKQYSSGVAPIKDIRIKEFEYLEYTSGNVHKLYISDNQSWRLKLYETFVKYIEPTPHLQRSIDVVDATFSSLSGIKVGILKRNQLLKCEQVSGSMPHINEYLNIINEIEGNKTLILSVDNETDLNTFRSMYPNDRCIFSKSIRRTNVDTDREPHFTPSSVQDAIYYFMDVYMLSKCDYLIHPISNMATAALYMNPNLKSIYLQ
jgi:hypothetical protein